MRKRQETTIVDTRKANFKGSQNLNFTLATSSNNQPSHPKIKINDRSVGRESSASSKSIAETKSEEERRLEKISSLQARLSISKPDSSPAKLPSIIASPASELGKTQSSALLKRDQELQSRNTGSQLLSKRQWQKNSEHTRAFNLKTKQSTMMST